MAIKKLLVADVGMWLNILYLNVCDDTVHIEKRI